MGGIGFGGFSIDVFLEYKAEAVIKAETNSFPANVATPDLFHKVSQRKRSFSDEKLFIQFPIPISDDEQFKEGQKLEAVDPLEMSRICPATVSKVKQFLSFNLSIAQSM